MHRSRKTLERCIELALETGVLAKVARGLGCSAKTIRNWRDLSIQSPREHIVTLPNGGEQPFHLALKMALQPYHVPPKRRARIQAAGVR
jgi:hypothetical protein